MIIGGSKVEVIENIKKSIENEEFNEKVEVNDPNLSLQEKEKLINDYLKKINTFGYKINNRIARIIWHTVMCYQNRDTEIIGIENIKDIKNGAFVTSNHFNPLENMVVKNMIYKTTGKRLYVICQENNLAMPGFLGYMVNYSDIIPISSQISYTKNEFQSLIKKAFEKNNFILIYPEQEMWFNYRKPRPLKSGAYYYASKYNVPIVSCFVEIIDKQKKDNDEFNKVKYKIHILKPIYPDKDKSDKENSAWMLERDYAQKKEAYEKAYGKKLDYTFDYSDIAGWRKKGQGEK